MKFTVSFTLFTNRHSDIRTGYRPSWKLPGTSNSGTGRIMFDGATIFPGETRVCTLETLMSEMWINVKVGDTLPCMEGLKQVGSAVILAIQ